MQQNWFETPGPDGAARRLAYTDWGVASEQPAVLCVHGLTRNGRDFDALAAALAGERRVICPDLVGRGKSDWLADPAGYANPAYVGHIVALLEHLGMAPVQHHMRAGLGHRRGHGKAKPARGAGHQHGLAVEPEKIRHRRFAPFCDLAAPAWPASTDPSDQAARNRRSRRPRGRPVQPASRVTKHLAMGI